MSNLYNSAYATYQNPSNATIDRKMTQYNYQVPKYSDNVQEMYQEHTQYSGNAYQVGLKNVFGRDEYSQESVGVTFFSERNVKRIQKLIRKEIYERTQHKYIIEEDQDDSDLLVAMRAVYKMNGKFMSSKIVHQVKELNMKLINYIVPDMITEIKQYYGYLKDVNEPLKPIDRPMNVSNAGRKTLPSITTIWSM